MLQEGVGLVWQVHCDALRWRELASQEVADAREDGIMVVVVPPPIECVRAGIQHMKEGLPLPTQDTRRSCDPLPQMRMQVGIMWKCVCKGVECESITTCSVRVKM